MHPSLSARASQRSRASVSAQARKNCSSLFFSSSTGSCPLLCVRLNLVSLTPYQSHTLPSPSPSAHVSIRPLKSIKNACMKAIKCMCERYVRHALRHTARCQAYPHPYTPHTQHNGTVHAHPYNHHTHLTPLTLRHR